MIIEYIKCDSYDATTNTMVTSSYTSGIIFKQNIKIGIFSKPIDIPRVGEYIMFSPKTYVVCKVVHVLANKELQLKAGKMIYVIEKY